jgi:hypothetical protein
MGFDPYVVLAALIVGFTVGLTGMGGGALMTPILVLLFKVEPLAAVSSDLVAAMIMKPIGSGVHIRRRTVRWELVKWLCVGSIPSAFAGVLLLRALGDGQDIQGSIKLMLGMTLCVAASAMVFKSWLQGRRAARARTSGNVSATPAPKVKALPTILIGVVGGLLVGLTSVGSGSLIIVCLMLLYPYLRGAELVGTDLVQAVPLVASAAIAHVLFGDFEPGLTGAVLLGSIPGVYVGARLSSKAPDGLIRPALVLVLVASGVKLIGASTEALGLVILALALIGLPLWGAVDAAGFPESRWEQVGRPRSWWIRVQAVGSIFVVGFGLAVAYFWKVRPALSTVEAH